jgi:putative oxidoreductase
VKVPKGYAKQLILYGRVRPSKSFSKGKRDCCSCRKVEGAFNSNTNREILMLVRIFNPLKDYSILVLRLGVGGVFIGHGYLKLTTLQQFAGFLEQTGTPFPGIMAPMVAAVEFLGGVAILLGTGTRIAALLLTGVMAVAMLTVTAARGFAGGYDINLALLGGLLCLLFGGPGKFALGGDL